MKSHTPAKFVGHRRHGNENKIVLACHVMLQDHVIIWSCEFMDGTPSW